MAGESIVEVDWETQRGLFTHYFTWEQRIVKAPKWARVLGGWPVGDYWYVREDTVASDRTFENETRLH